MEKAGGPDHPNVATVLNNLGLLYLEEGNYAEAESAFRRSLAILEKTLGPEHPAVAQNLGNYAKLLDRTGRESEAAEMRARAEAILAKQNRGHGGG
jgi:tetratricopeptide (TPR) repeat protein